MLSQLAIRAARPEAIRQKCAEERALRRGLAQGRSEEIPKGSAARVKPPIHEAGSVRIEASSGAACEEGAPKPGFARSQREDGAMRATRFKDRTSAAPARSFDVRPAIHPSGQASGLYDPALEKDSCGVGFIADIKGRKSHKIVDDALKILLNLEHRGAVGADPRAGDGAGILVQIPHKFFARKAAELGFALPAAGAYAVGVLFMPHEEAWRQEIRDIFAEEVAREGMQLIGWRDVPTDNSSLGWSVKPTEPVHQQVFVGKGARNIGEDEFERRLYILRKTISGRLYLLRARRNAGYYPVSLSCRTAIYKGMFLADQLGSYYPDLHEADFESALALVHQRFSTNT